MAKNLILTIIAHQGYIRHENESEYALQNDILFSAISQTYLPLLNMFHRFEDEGVDGIETVAESEQQSDTYYTVTGVKTTKPQRGIYIQSGKKVVKY